MFIDQTQVQNALNTGFFGKSVLVIGDLMLDRYLWGEVSRISPEAPVPVVRLLRETESCGGAANVALNLASLGIKVRVAGWIGPDSEGKRLTDILNQAGVDTSGIRMLNERTTITKTRIIGGHQQMLRLDNETNGPLPESILSSCLEGAIQQLFRETKPHVVVLSDYGKGTLTESVCQPLIQTAREEGIPLLVDPKGVNYHKYRSATMLTPNRRELMSALPLETDDLNQLLTAAEQMRKFLKLDYLTVTLSEQGIALLQSGESPRRIPSMAREVYDVSGAGDTVISTLAAGLAAELAPMDALHLANLAAGVVVAKVGTTPITRLELMAAFSKENSLEQSDKVCDIKTACTRIALWRQRGEHIVFTNGCFDLLHAGHVTYLEGARNLGKRLVVGLNTDQSVRRLKGPSRPVIHEADRARVLAAMASVDMVILFDEETPLNLIQAIHPDVLAKGADYQEHEVVGAEEIKAWGGRVALVPLVEGRSSSRIFENIKRS